MGHIPFPQNVFLVIYALLNYDNLCHTQQVCHHLCFNGSLFPAEHGLDGNPLTVSPPPPVPGEATGNGKGRIPILSTNKQPRNTEGNTQYADVFIYKDDRTNNCIHLNTAKRISLSEPVLQHLVKIHYLF